MLSTHTNKIHHYSHGTQGGKDWAPRAGWVPSELGKGVRDGLSNKVTLRLRGEGQGACPSGGGERAVPAERGDVGRPNCSAESSLRAAAQSVPPMTQRRVSGTVARS